MKLDFRSKKVLITGLDSFTGRYLRPYLESQGYDIQGLEADLTHRVAVIDEVNSICPDYVIHLAAISFAAEQNIDEIYRVNVVGTINLLDGISALDKKVNKVILASSATVYGDQSSNVWSESMLPLPVNHYGCSKLSMEYMARTYFDKIPIIIVRPFNYTGIGHAQHFLIPKIVKAYQDKKSGIELGNLDVSREFNDVRDVCLKYHDLLECNASSEVINICSGRSVSLTRIMGLMNSIAGYNMEITVNPAYVRENEIKDLSGDCIKLNKYTQSNFSYQIEDTLCWMYGSNDD
jgi:nucleoside-diphosphate-sugar epimerase